MTVRLDRLERALYQAFSGAAATVAWTRGEVPHAQVSAGSYLTMMLTAGPTPVHRHRARGAMLLPADSVVVRILAATPDKRLIVRLNGFDYYHDVTGVDTLTTIRDALSAAIAADEPSLTLADDGTDGFEITAASLGALRSLELLGGDTEIGSDPPVFSGDAVLVTEAAQRLLVNVQAFSKVRTLSGGAVNVAQAAHDRLQAEDVLEALHREGFAVWDLGGITDISGISGARWETRATFDVTLAARSVFTRPVHQIEEVTINVEAS